MYAWGINHSFEENTNDTRYVFIGSDEASWLGFLGDPDVPAGGVAVYRRGSVDWVRGMSLGG